VTKKFLLVCALAVALLISNGALASGPNVKVTDNNAPHLLWFDYGQGDVGNKCCYSFIRIDAWHMDGYTARVQFLINNQTEFKNYKLNKDTYANGESIYYSEIPLHWKVVSVTAIDPATGVAVDNLRTGDMARFLSDRDVHPCNMWLGKNGLWQSGCDSYIGPECR